VVGLMFLLVKLVLDLPGVRFVLMFGLGHRPDLPADEMTSSPAAPSAMGALTNDSHPDTMQPATLGDAMDRLLSMAKWKYPLVAR
jgi:hypothetical protein